MKFLEIKNKWYAGFAVIYCVKDQLLFYDGEIAPSWNRGDKVPYDEIMATKVYKQLPFTWDNVPNDASMAL